MAKQTRDRVDSVQAAAREDFVSSLSQKRAFAATPQDSGKAAAAFSSAGGRGLMAGIEEMLAARKKMVAGGIWMLARSPFSFLLSSLLLG